MSWREGKNSAQRGYGAKWRKARETYLSHHPLCIYCQKQGRTTAAMVVDHIKPHKGNQKLFWDKNNWQPLCKNCHDSVKKHEENGVEVITFGADGLPIDGWD